MSKGTTRQELAVIASCTKEALQFTFPRWRPTSGLNVRQELSTKQMALNGKCYAHSAANDHESGIASQVIGLKLFQDLSEQSRIRARIANRLSVMVPPILAPVAYL